MKDMARFIAVVLFLLCTMYMCYARPTVTVGTQVVPAHRIPIDQISHATWSNLLKKHVDSMGMVDYQTWLATPLDLESLDSYLNHLSSATLSPQSAKNITLAYWINAYNAVTIKGILREYPTTSIKNHDSKFFGYKIWDDLQLWVADDSYSLNHIEHKILRPMQEPRIHFAIVCASKGCPRLLDEAYVGQKLDQQLRTNAEVFFANKNNLQFDTSRKTIFISKILSWFGNDFGKTTADQMRRIAPLLPESARKLAESKNTQVHYLEYDWDLNDQSQTPP